MNWNRALAGAVGGIRITVLGSILVLVSIGVRTSHSAEDPFAANVRPTDPLTPQEQLKAFEVPPGFEVQWVASEPDIHKPMNMAFDATGRLWVTTTREYPRPAPPDRPGRDRVMIFEDFGPDGRARKVTEFASGLNIPIGIYPYRAPSSDGQLIWKAVVWSIPNLWLLEDTDGDGKADKRERLYGPFDHTRDTHGNQASFRRGFDGWLYATHGYNNDSHVIGRDGNTVHMNSGNTYRVRLDGSRIEHHTWGQVNPFGLAWDPSGNLYSSDCHSEPIYLLQAGGYYPSFGKPHDGLGFAPNMMEQIRGSTAIDGISYYADDLWPEEYRDSIFIGDVMTSRVYRDAAVARGSGKIARPQPDFVISRDSWFRPVDTLLGPDGALYIADFYNRIIGHYEVPLDHPGRDRERGRIWRVISHNKPLRSPALPSDAKGLIDELASPSLPRRMLAMNDLTDRFGAANEAALRAVVASPRNAYQAVHALWLLQRLGALDQAPLLASIRSAEPLIRIHAVRIVAERARLTKAGTASGAALNTELIDAVVAALKDSDPQVQRCAAEALAVSVRFENLRPLLDLRERVDAKDTHLVYGVRQAIRNNLASDAIFARVLEQEGQWSTSDIQAILDVSLSVRSSAAVRWLLKFHDRYASDGEFTQAAFAHAARYGDAPELETLARLASARLETDLDTQVGLFRSIQQGFSQRGSSLTDTLRKWGSDLSSRLLASLNDSHAWSSVPLDGTLNPAAPWYFQERPCQDGSNTRLVSSHPQGEQLTGRLRSRPFTAPAKFTFYFAGHDGPPASPALGLSRALLRDATTGVVLLETAPPRNDTAQKIEWDLSKHVGKRVVFEAIDGNSAGAWAWIAVGRWDPALIPVPSVAPAEVINRQIAAAELTVACGGERSRSALQLLILDKEADPAVRGAAIRALNDDPLQRAVADVLVDPSQPFPWRDQLADAVLDEDRSGREPFLTSVWRDAPRRFQIAVAGIAAVRPQMVREVVDRMKDGRAPAGLLQDRRLREKLSKAADPETQASLQQLAASLPDEDATIQRLLEQRRVAFLSATPDSARGEEVFKAACAVCHRIGEQGALVGPQLTGIGTRGIERLCEDILAPNRNVDHAFWTTVLTLKDGDGFTGLFRREEGEVLVLANAAGTEFSVKKGDILERKENNTSVMPTNFGEALSEKDFNDLLGYLLSQRGVN